MDCGGVFVKYVLYIFNILFVFCGVFLIVLGSLAVAKIGHIDSVEVFYANSISISVLIIGCVMFVIASLGCCGAIRENACCTMTYSALMFVLLLCQVAVIVFAWTQRDEFLRQVDIIVQKIWEQHQANQKAMDVVQLSFDCCGKNSYLDYGLQPIPNSCCGVEATTCNATQVLNKLGCSRAVSTFTQNYLDSIRYAGLGVAAVELVAFIFGCCLANQVRNDRRRSMY